MQRSFPSRSEPEPDDLQAHASENLRFIRRTMESAGSFTAVSGIGQITIGITALIAAVVAHAQPTPGRWLSAWLAEAALASLIGVIGVVRKAKATGLSLSSGAARKFAVCFAPPLVAGALMTPALYRAGSAQMLPGAWLILFGAAVITGGALSVRIVPFMGAPFMLLGALALYLRPNWGDLFMALGFGGLMIGFGIVIARKHGG